MLERDRRRAIRVDASSTRMRPLRTSLATRLTVAARLPYCVQGKPSRPQTCRLPRPRSDLAPRQQEVGDDMKVSAQHTAASRPPSRTTGPDV